MIVVVVVVVRIYPFYFDSCKCLDWMIRFFLHVCVCVYAYECLFATTIVAMEIDDDDDDEDDHHHYHRIINDDHHQHIKAV